MKHLISVEDLTVEDVKDIFNLAEQCKSKAYVLDKQVFAANLFFEPSTRTKMSFIVAERKLQMESLDFHEQLSSISKGESLLDTVKTFEAIGAHVLVIRHEADEWSKELTPQVSIPIINAGAGMKDHPTQSLLDAYTIYEEYGSFESLNIVIAGDIKHSRVAHSSLALFESLGANIYVAGAREQMDQDLIYPYISMDEAVKLADVLMLLRIQHERHHHKMDKTKSYLEAFGLTIEREKQMKDGAIIMHPGPVNRGVEIASTLVESERSRIFKQMQNGVYIRMAILIKLLQNWGTINENHLKQC